MLKQSRVDQNVRSWDLFSAFLLFILLQILAGRLATTEWIENLKSIAGFIIPALMLGLLIGYSRLPGWVSWGMGIIHGLVAVSTLLGVVYAPGILWAERVILLYERMHFSVLILIEAMPLEDPILFFTVISALLWIISIAAGFYLTRRGTSVFAVISATILFFLIDRYDLANKLRSFYYFVFLLTIITLLMRSNLNQNQRRWDKAEILTPPGVSFELTRTAVIIVLVILSVVWIAPSVSKVSVPAARLWREMTRPLDGPRETLANALNSLKSSGNVVAIQFFDTLQIGNNAPQESTIIFTSKAFGLDPMEQRYYWRTRSYNIYRYGTWKSNVDTRLDQTETALIPAAEDWSARTVYTFQITTQSDRTNMLVTEQSPYLFSIPEVLYGLEVSPGTVDAGYFKPQDPLDRGITYRVTSMKSIPTIQQLQKSGSQYPDWVSTNYLDVPANIDPLVKEMADLIIKDLDNPYDRVDAVTSYLRKNYKYITNLPPTIQGDDPLEVFLFEDKQGFCNHFATAEVLLLRSVGIPARLTVGFAEGEFSEDSGLYLVRRKDTHAWPEVYFNNYGWVIFEPTTNQEQLVYEESLRQNARSQESDLSGRLDDLPLTPEPVVEEDVPASDVPLKRQPFHSTERFSAYIILLLLSAGLITVMFLLLIKLPEGGPSMASIVEKNLRKTGITPPRWLIRWAVYNRRTTLEQAFLLPDVLFGLLKVPYNAVSTIDERVGLWLKELPEITPYAIILQQEYDKVIYGGERGNLLQARQASRMIQRKIISTAIFRIFQKKASK